MLAGAGLTLIGSLTVEVALVLLLLSVSRDRLVWVLLLGIALIACGATVLFVGQKRQRTP